MAQHEQMKIAAKISFKRLQTPQIYMVVDVIYSIPPFDNIWNDYFKPT